MTTLEDWETWLTTAKPGSEITYATAGTLGDKDVTAETLAIAEAAKRAYAAGVPLGPARALLKTTGPSGAS